MTIVQITPGAGGMYCGNCFRDNALVGALRQQGHSVLMVPLYLPMTLDEEDQTRGAERGPPGGRRGLLEGRTEPMKEGAG